MVSLKEANDIGHTRKVTRGHIVYRTGASFRQLFFQGAVASYSLGASARGLDAWPLRDRVLAGRATRTRGGTFCSYDVCLRGAMYRLCSEVGARTGAMIQGRRC